MESKDKRKGIVTGTTERNSVGNLILILNGKQLETGKNENRVRPNLVAIQEINSWYR